MDCLAHTCSMDLLELMGAAPLDPQLPLPGSAFRHSGFAASGQQQSAPLPAISHSAYYAAMRSSVPLPPRQPAAAALGGRTASGSIGQKRLCTWDEHPQPAPAMRRSCSVQLSAAAPRPAPAAAPACPAAQQQGLEARFAAQRQKLMQLLLQLQQVRAAMQDDAAAAAPGTLQLQRASAHPPLPAADMFGQSFLN